MSATVPRCMALTCPQVCSKDFFLKTVPLFDGGDDVGMVLSPQCFHNLNLHTDIFNHSNVHFWEYMQPGYDALSFISCTGTNFLVSASHPPVSAGSEASQGQSCRAWVTGATILMQTIQALHNQSKAILTLFLAQAKHAGADVLPRAAEGGQVLSSNRDHRLCPQRGVEQAQHDVPLIPHLKCPVHRAETCYVFAQSAAGVQVRSNALLEVGGSPTWTLTEDYALGMELKKYGWHCRYVQEYLAIGEAPDQIRNCYQQRSRWCKARPPYLHSHAHASRRYQQSVDSVLHGCSSAMPSEPPRR